MRSLLILLANFSFSCSCLAQYREIARYGTAEGLPTNFIYNCVEDHLGFLWIATDQAAIRYDGRQFQQFTTNEGLPDNEVLKVLRERNGTIWVHSFKQLPAYFDHVKNRFISAKEDTLLRNISSRRLLFCSNTLEGGINFYSEKGSTIILKGQRFDFNYQNPTVCLLTFSQTNRNSCLSVSSSNDFQEYFINDYSRQVLKESKLFYQGGHLDANRGNVVFDKKLYCLFKANAGLAGSQLVCLSNIKTSPLRFDSSMITLSKEMNHLSITTHYIIPIYADNTFELYDAETMKKVQLIKTDYVVNSVFEDSKGGLWVCTTEKGIIRLDNSLVHVMNVGEQSEVACMSITRSKEDIFFIGTSDNRILEVKKGETMIHPLPVNTMVRGWLKEILLSDNKVFTFSDAGCYINYTKPILHPVNGKHINGKAACILDDSTIMIGTHDGLYSLNTGTEKLTQLSNQETRVTSIVPLDKTILYYGSINGLHKYDLHMKEDKPLSSLNPLLEERVIALCKTTDSIIWIATAGNGMIALRHDTVISHITKQQGLITNSLRTICAGQEGQILVGTNEGLSFVDFSQSILHPIVKNLSVSDGLTSNIINRIFYHHDTVYAATSLGASVIPCSVAMSMYEIPIRLMAVKINQQDQFIRPRYELKAGQYNINLLFGGIEIGGHFRNAQLSVDKGATWTDIEGNRLSLQLGSGEHPIWLRAVDINRHISRQILKLQFSIATPYYSTWWFVFLVFAILLTTCVFLYVYWTRKKHKQQLQVFSHQQELDELEIQALKSQINPHFVFNCLNSIQGLIYEEDFENANLYLRKFSDILRSTLNYSGQNKISLKAELEYIQTYLSLEKLRFGDKIEFEIVMQEGLSSGKIEIPAMLLQPFVENAIHHGLGLLKGVVGKLSINVYLANEVLNITIDDNGVGRKKAGQLKKQLDNTHESKGTQLTQRRLDLYRIGLRIIDKTNENGNAIGTTIHLNIPNP